MSSVFNVVLNNTEMYCIMYHSVYSKVQWGTMHHTTQSCRTVQYIKVQLIKVHGSTVYPIALQYSTLQYVEYITTYYLIAFEKIMVQRTK